MATIITDEAQTELVRVAAQNALAERLLTINQCDSLITSLQTQLTDALVKRDKAQAEIESINGIVKQI